MLKTAIAALYLLSIPGPSAWAQVARVGTAVSLPVVASAPMAISASAVPALGSAPVLLAAPALSVAPTLAAASAPVPLAAPAAVPAAEAAPSAVAAPAPANESVLQAANDFVPAADAASHAAIARRVQGFMHDSAASFAASAPDEALPAANEDAHPAALKPAAVERFRARDAVVLAAFGVAVVAAYGMAIHGFTAWVQDMEAGLRGMASDPAGAGGIFGGVLISARGVRAAGRAAPSALKRKLAGVRNAVAGTALVLAMCAAAIGVSYVAADLIMDGVVDLRQLANPAPPADQVVPFGVPESPF